MQISSRGRVNLSPVPHRPVFGGSNRSNILEAHRSPGLAHHCGGLWFANCGGHRLGSRHPAHSSEPLEIDSRAFFGSEEGREQSEPSSSSSSSGEQASASDRQEGNSASTSSNAPTLEDQGSPVVVKVEYSKGPEEESVLHKYWRRGRDKVAQIWAVLVSFVLARTSWLPLVRRRLQLRRVTEDLFKYADDPDRHAAFLKVLNNQKRHDDVIKQWDNAQYPVNDSCTAEYIKALVFTGRISSFTAAEMLRGGGSPQAHSMADLLRHCQHRLEGGKGDVLQPGTNSLKPLHVVIQGGALHAAQKSSSFVGNLLRTILSFFVTTAVITALLVMGYMNIKRYNPAPPVTSVPAGTSVSPPSTSFAPKEYNKETMPEKSVKTFADVQGCEEAKAEVEEIVEFLKHPKRFTRLGGKLPKGVLLTGPPGTGKTLLARAIAGEAGVPFYFRAGSEFEEMFVGVGSRRVRTLFAAAKKNAPCIVFIDEIDAIGQARGNSLENGSSKTLNQLLVEMDGFEVNEGVVVIAATNLEHKLDPALTRPGRFDREVAVPLPDVQGRLQIINYYLKGKPLSPDVDAQLLARRTPGFSGAQLNNLINEAALNAAKNGKDAITAHILDEARDKILMGSPRTLMVQSTEARKLTAYHESGHALVALNTPGATPIHKATIVPRGHSLGMVSLVPHNDEHSITKQQLTASIDVSMGGRVAEELIFGEDQVTTGATSDLAHATRQARHMVMDCGMSSKIGPVAVPNEKSAETRQLIDSEVARMLREAYTRVTNMLKEKQDDLHKLATALLEHETLTAAEIQQVLDGTFRKTPIGKGLTQSEVQGVANNLGPESRPLNQHEHEANNVRN